MACRILKKCPELVESYQEISIQLLSDRQHGVLLTAVTLISQICQLDSSSLEEYRRYVPQLCRILRSLVVSGFSPEHDCGGINDPFLQVQILKLLRILGNQNVDASDQMSDILAQVATNTESMRNTGNSILYECVQTIMNVESTSGLRVLGINILGRFLSNKDNNIRYVALNTLAKVVTIDAQAVQRHRETIVDCVKDADVSIRKIALELVYSLVNETNIKNLTKELLDYLEISDPEFKPDLTYKICTLIQRFSPDKKWHVDNIVKIMIQSGQYVREEVCRGFVVLITNAPNLQGYTVRKLYKALEDHIGSGFASLITISCWCIGEFGEHLLSGDLRVEDENVFTIGQSEIVDLLQKVLQTRSDVTAKEYALTALMKLTPKLGGEKERIRSLIDRYKSDVILEVQQRCCEYVKILDHDRLCSQLFERMPALDEKKFMISAAIDVALPQENGTAENGAPLSTEPDLLGLSDILGSETSNPPAQSATSILDDLMGSGVSTPPRHPGPDLLDVLSSEAPVSLESETGHV